MCQQGYWHDVLSSLDFLLDVWAEWGRSVLFFFLIKYPIPSTRIAKTKQNKTKRKTKKQNTINRNSLKLESLRIKNTAI